MIVQERSRVLVRGGEDFGSAAALWLSRACHAVAGRDWSPTPKQDLGWPRFDRAELAGAVADLGVMVPIAVALIVKNGLSATAVLLPAGLLYVAAGLLYRVPVPVQPLKAFGAIAIAQGLGSSEIAAGALLMGGVFVALGAFGWLDRVARVFPHPIIRGVQLSVGLLFCQLAWTLITAPPATFADHTRPVWWLVGGGVVVAAAALLLRRQNVTLILVVIAAIAMTFGYHGPLTFGPSPFVLPDLSTQAFVTAAVALVLPQLPLTFANSCLATADAARTYFGPAGARVRPGRLALSLGVANLLAGGISGMPVCHGAGGMTAHFSFGARTGGAPVALGAVLLALAFIVGASLAKVLAGFPLPILGGLLFAQGVFGYEPLRKGRRERLEDLRTGDGRPLPGRLKAQIIRELDRLDVLLEQLKTVEAERDALLKPATDAAASPPAMLVRLKGIGSETAAVLWSEGLFRQFDNRRQVAAYAGLAPTPWQSGSIDHEQGASKAGNPRLRTTMVELAWLWLQNQPTSALSLWFHERVRRLGRRMRKTTIVALARKLLIALWRYTTAGVVIEGAVMKAAPATI